MRAIGPVERRSTNGPAPRALLTPGRLLFCSFLLCSLLLFALLRRYSPVGAGVAADPESPVVLPAELPPLDGPPPALALLRLKAPPPAPQRGPGDPKELERFADEVFGQYMGQLHVPGAVFSCVRNGRVLFEKGYGFANLAARAPVLPNRTLFRVGSVSKLFVATAAMQLAEQGRLDFHADVNRYLEGMKIPGRFSRPVTMAGLLTHTAGFDEQIIGMAARSEEDAPPLQDYLRRRMPPRVLPPGTVVSYSNHGSALAGLLVQQISGEPFSEYVDRHIFEPLQMHHSSFSLPARLAPDMAVGYEYDARAGKVYPVPHDAIVVAPAGALNSTADDMAHFMIAHLQDGQFGDHRILKAATAQEMHRQQFAHDPRLPGFCYGFYERRQNGLRGIQHGGNWRGFSTLLFLLPSEKTGFFIASNSSQPLLPEVVAWALVNHYYPSHSASLSSSPDLGQLLGKHSGQDWRRRAASGRVVRTRGHSSRLGTEDLARFAGAYRFTRYDRHTPCKLFAAFGEVRLTVRGAGLMMSLPGACPTRWRQEDRLLFRLEGSGSDPIYLSFKLNSHGQVAFACLGIISLERLAWYDTVSFHSGLALCEAAVFLLLAVIPRSLLLRGMRGESDGDAGDEELDHAAYLDRRRQIMRVIYIGRKICLLNLISLFLLPFAFLDLGFDVVYGVPLDVRLMMLFPVFSGLMSVVPGAWVAGTWGSGQWRPLARVLLPLQFAAYAAFLWQVHYWNLLPWRV